MMSDRLNRLAKASAVAFGVTGFALAATGALAGPIFLSASATFANHVQQVSFWGRPYPYGYSRPLPLKWACYAWRPIETPVGTRYERVRICGNVVTERY